MPTGWLTPLHEWWVRLRLGAGGPMRLPPIERARWLLRLGRILRNSGRYPEAEAACQEALGILDGLLRPDHSMIAAALFELWRLYATSEDARRLVPVLERVVAIQEEVWGPGHSTTRDALLHLSHSCYRLGDYEKAEECYRRLIERLDQADEMNFEALAEACRWLAEILIIRERYEEARSFFRRSLTAYQTAEGPFCDGVRGSLYSLAWLCAFKLEELPNAERFLRRLRALERHRFGRMDPERIGTLQFLGWARLELGRYDFAEDSMLKALGILRQSPDADDSTARTLDLLADLYERRGDPARAESLCRQAIDQVGGLDGSPSSSLASYLLRLTALLRVQGKTDQLMPSIERLIGMSRQGLLDEDRGDLIEELDACAAMLDDMGRSEEAEKIRREMEKLKADPGAT